MSLADLIHIEAPAKINLGLRVLGRRPDGYHNLVTIFQRVSLADKVTLSSIPHGVEYFGPPLTAKDSDNLCVKAAHKFLGMFGGGGVRITLDKFIPSGAGLGGGSSDAAAVLLGMRRLFAPSLNEAQLIEFGAEIGSDVPFFLLDNPAAIGQGRGEQLKLCSGLSASDWVTIVWPGFSTSTAEAYRKLDEALTFDPDKATFNVYQFLQYSGGIPTAGMGNDFELPIFAAHPDLAAVRNRLKQLGALHSGLCGSGSALFGIYSRETEARMAASQWAAPYLSFVCRPC